jgi:hypothetical protein
MKPSEVLRKAKALIDSPEKWWESSKRCLDYQYCALRAIIRVLAYGYAGVVQIFARANNIRPSSDGSFEWPVANWNDAPERTHADVMAAFDRAIALAESEEK